MFFDYSVCCWRLRSTIAIPDLIPWPVDDQCSPDIQVTEGNVPDRLERSITPSRYLMIDPPGTILLQIGQHVRFLIQDGRCVTVQMLQPGARGDWHIFLLGTVLCYICHQRGVFPLHAATLGLNGLTIALAGPQGVGKSTLAFALNRRGHDLFSDDLTVIADISGQVQVLPAFPRLKLWLSALEAAGIAPDGLERVRPEVEKFALKPHGDFDTAPRPLDAVIVLREDGEAATLTRLQPVIAMPVIQANIPRYQAAIALGQQGRLFADTARLVSSVPVYRLSRPKRFEDLPDTLTLLERMIGS